MHFIILVLKSNQRMIPMNKETLEKIRLERDNRKELLDHIIISDHYFNYTVTEKKHIMPLIKELKCNIKQNDKTIKINGGLQND